jgi:hypothetical protein
MSHLLKYFVNILDPLFLDLRFVKTFYINNGKKGKEGGVRPRKKRNSCALYISCAFKERSIEKYKVFLQ